MTLQMGLTAQRNRTAEDRFSHDLFEFIEHDQVEAFQALIQQIPDINCQNDTSQTLLQMASFKNRETIALFLLEFNDIDYNRRDCQNLTALHFACRSGSVAIVEALLQKPGIEIDGEDAYGNTPLQYALRYPHSLNHRDIVCLLIDYVSDTYSEESRLTLYHYLLNLNSAKLVQHVSQLIHS